MGTFPGFVLRYVAARSRVRFLLACISSARAITASDLDVSLRLNARMPGENHTPPNKKLQRTRHGQNGASPLNLVLAGRLRLEGMRLTTDDLAGLGVALNEARWLGQRSTNTADSRLSPWRHSRCRLVPHR